MAVTIDELMVDDSIAHSVIDDRLTVLCAVRELQYQLC